MSALRLPGHAQALVTLITHNRATGFRAEDAVDFSAGNNLVALTAPGLPQPWNRHMATDESVGALAGVIGTVAFINAGIVVIRIVSGSVVAVAIAVRIPIIVRIESRVVDEPEAVDEVATMSMPPMITAPVPITMPIR